MRRRCFNEERAASKQREAEHGNAKKRVKRTAKLNMGPILRSTSEQSEKKIKIKRQQLKPQDQQTSHQKPKSNVNNSRKPGQLQKMYLYIFLLFLINHINMQIQESQEDSNDNFLEDMDRALMELSSANNKINPLGMFPFKK